MPEAVKITTVFFDWDYTLAYTRTPENTMSERLATMFALAGLDYTEEEIGRALQQYERDVAHGAVERIEQPQTRRDIARQYTYLLKELEHPDRSWPLLMRLYGTYAQLPTFLYEDSLSTLRRVCDLGYRIGILSNHSHTARPVMEERVGAIVPPDQIVISEEEGVHKPAKSFFRRAAARLHTPPEQCLLIGDNLRVDAIGAVKTGGFGCGVWLDRKRRGKGRSLPPGVKRITALRQLPDLLPSRPVPE